MSFEHVAYKSEGGIKFTSQTTPRSSQTICTATIGPKYVVPIIFIPGIMGSNLIHNNGDKVWFPPNGVAALIQVMKGIFRTAKDRQEQLDPLETRVSNEGDIKIKNKFIHDFTEEKARLRGWGTVWWSGYGKILMYLEQNLNQELVRQQADSNTFRGGEEWHIFTQVGDASDAQKAAQLNKKWQPDSKLELLTQEMHAELADYAFPVFALGYNWLQSNEDSAQDIAKRLESFVKPQVKREFPRATFKKFIIVTHSMGGLVARSLIQTKSKSDILGVVHGVMPASGAPAVYQRISNGWDAKATTGSIIDSISSLIFGHNSARLTSVLGNSPGALQLLPFANFRNAKGKQDWLQLEAKNLSGQTITANLPQKNDPYNEIYMNRDAWWRMINSDALDPAGGLKKRLEMEYKSDIFSFYEELILITRDFQEDISNSYHNNTYAHYGDDPKFKSFSQIKWTSNLALNVKNKTDLIMFNGTNNGVSKALLNGKKNESVDRAAGIETKEKMKFLFSADGKRFITDSQTNREIHFQIRIKPTSNGDGTVCVESALDIRREGIHLKQTYAINGYGHAASYDHVDVQRNTLYCIAKVLLNTTSGGKSRSSSIHSDSELA